MSPQWDVTIHDESELAPGYWFLTPYERIGERRPGGAWIGPHIYDQWGGLIWSGSYLFNDINIMDFKLSNVKGQDRLTMMYPVEGLGYIFDNHYEIVEKVPVGITGVTLNMHEFNFVENGKTLLLLKRNTTHATKEMSKATGYDGECYLTFDGFEEVDTENWETQFAWSTWGNVGLDESTMDQARASDRCEGGAWDYMSVLQDLHQHYIVSDFSLATQTPSISSQTVTTCFLGGIRTRSTRSRKMTALSYGDWVGGNQILRLEQRISRGSITHDSSRRMIHIQSYPYSTMPKERIDRSQPAPTPAASSWL